MHGKQFDSELEKAQFIIQQARGKKLTLEERSLKAVELAEALLNEGRLQETEEEKKINAELARLMHDPTGKVFTMSLTDQCFRTENSWRVADQIQFLLQRLGVPQYLSPFKKFQLYLFKIFGKVFAPILVPLVKNLLHKECSRFILPGEKMALANEIHRRQEKNLRINLNHLGEAILGEKEAEHRLKIYLEDLRKPEIEYISVKISTICSQLNLLAWEETLSILSERLKELLRTAYVNKFKRADGVFVSKFVNLDMEEYRDLELTVDLFQKVLDDPEFMHHSAGIVLQSYLPDSFKVQKILTEWAMKRVEKGGAPIKIRLVKGANLAMEKVDAALHGWPQAPYLLKEDVDANFKQMVTYALQKEHAKAAIIGIGSHNLFDIAYALILRAENEIENEVNFEMLEGMADSQRRVVQTLAGDMLLYCPAADKSEFQNAVAYLIRRLDENTSPENFLRQAFKLHVGSPEWEEQKKLFLRSCEKMESISNAPSRKQNRQSDRLEDFICCRFENTQDTDWSLSPNRLWAKKIVDDWSHRPKETIPLVIGGQALFSASSIKQGFNPSNQKDSLYSYILAGDKEIEMAVQTAVHAQERWSKKTVQERVEILGKVADLLKLHRADLMGVMAADTGKILPESDVEISEAIDFVEYYRRNLEEIHYLQDIKWTPKGPTLVTPPWNFPCSIPIGGIAAALAAGNSVIFKPAPESIWVGWLLAQIFWQAGIDRDVLQFINCEDEPFGSQLVKDPRIAIIVLTGATATAKHFLKLKPGLNLIAETGGKNAMIISNMADRDQAVKDLVQSAFGHAGQKCSACSLAICLDEVYEDPKFRQQLLDAAASWKTGDPWDLATRLNPLIRPPGDILKRGFLQLDEGEEWLLKPEQDPINPCLWTPGIKLGVKIGSFTQQNELFGPVLGLMRAENLEEAIQMANQSRYGLTAGLHSLDLREQEIWSESIEAGNCYINRTMTGAIVQRQPFGGWKESVYSPGAKAGGPNYLMQFMHSEQIKLPEEREKISLPIFDSLLKQFSQREQDLWQGSVESYAFFWRHYFSRWHDPSQILGEDNFLRYIPQQDLNLRLTKADKPIDLLRVVTAAYICGAKINISAEKLPFLFKNFLEETDEMFVKRMETQPLQKVRFLSKPHPSLSKGLAKIGCYIYVAPPLANGRLELLHYLKEQSLTIAYHRYGNLGEREKDAPSGVFQANTCKKCSF